MKKKSKGSGLSASKARKMLHEGRANGRKITDRQRRYFGAVANGAAKKTRRKAY